MFFQQFLLTIALGLLLCVNQCSDGESLTCLTVYKEGGAPAVFQSPKCPRWKLSDYRSDRRTQKGSPSIGCQSAMHQGRRKTQEDRTLCALDIRIPFPSPTGITEVTVGVIAVFDGHNGAQASEMASKLLLEYFTLHTYFLLDSTFSLLLDKYTGRLPGKGKKGYIFRKLRWEELDQHVVTLGRFELDMLAILDGNFHLKILREALVKSIHDIDLVFAKDAFRGNFDAGSTATIILTADSQILVANVGDSKALLCSEEHQPPHEARATLLRLYREKRNDGDFPFLKDYRSLKTAAASGWNFLIAKELTKDHHPDREEERVRVESAGGYVSEWGGVARVNGQLAVSRAIGDVYFKSYGVVSLPEVNDWQPLTVNGSYLVAATDGIFEKLNSQDICDILWESQSDITESSELAYSCSYSLADCIVNAAFEKGSMDNMAAIVLPLTSMAPSEAVVKDICDGAGKFECSALEYKKHLNEQSELMELKQAHPVVAVFERLLVERKQSSSECFYLLENLNEVDDYTFWVEEDNDKYTYDQRHALPSSVDRSFGGALNMYSDQNMCMLFGMTDDVNYDQCTNPEGFSQFLGLLGSIPLNNGSDEHMTLDSRYILKKRYDRGSYGEVWLAFRWNCSKVSKNLQRSSIDKGFHFNTMPLRSHDEHLDTSSSADDCKDQCWDQSMFVLKRVMVERGPAVYLSGLREEHFGEIFLNASRFLRGSMSDEVSNSFGKSQSDICDNLNSNESAGQRIENCWSSENVSSRKRGLLGAVFEDGLNHIARFVESFESRSNEIWLVFRHEGVSLSKLLYTAEEVGTNEQRDEHHKRVQVLHPSKWWHWLKTTKGGQEEMQNLIWQLLLALKSCHDRNITHRDIKPENMVICIEDQDSGRCLKDFPNGDKNYSTKMRIIDFGSALDEFTMKHLYGSIGPSRAEQTIEYTPPEALLNINWHQGPKHSTLKYDMWSVGVVMLELILGSPNVFQINAKTRALLDQHLQGWHESIRELAYKLRSFMEMCILIPGTPSKLNRTGGTNDNAYVYPVPWKCSEEFFSQQIKNKDPLKIGFPNVWALRLVRELLQWNPEDRLSVDDALQHPYFSTAF